MIEVRTGRVRLGVVTLLGLSYASAVHIACEARDDGIYTGTTTSAAAQSQPRRSPMIIWFHGITKDPEVVRTALESGIITHVLLLGLHTDDQPSYRADPRLATVQQLCRKHQVKLIWGRWLFPGYKLHRFTTRSAFEAAYYAEQIRRVREEGQRFGAELVALDTEPYAHSPLMKIKRAQLSEKAYRRLQEAVTEAVRLAGRVDLVMPEGMPQPRHMYNALTPLGKRVIAECTFYDRPRWINNPPRPYDIFGAYLNISKENKRSPALRFFTPREILRRKDLWDHCDGLLIYPGEGEAAAAVARAFARIGGK